MRLFEIDETHNVRPNRQWIALIPEFAILLKKDKGSEGDSDGRKKLKARKQLAYIYFYCDFGSPIRDYTEDEKRKESRYYSGLTEEDEKEDILVAAINKYNELQYKAARSMRTFNAAKKGLDGLDKYLESINFTDVDKKGELLHDPDKYQKMLKGLNGMYKELREFEKFVEDDLKANPDAIQGQRTLGDNEARANPRMEVWSEVEVASRSAYEQQEGATFTQMESLVHKQRKTYTNEELDNLDILGDDN